MNVTAFSLAIVVLQLASAQYRSQVIQSFLADRGAQVVLGMFLGTLGSSLMAMRTTALPPVPQTRSYRCSR